MICPKFMLISLEKKVFAKKKCEYGDYLIISIDESICFW